MNSVTMNMINYTYKCLQVKISEKSKLSPKFCCLADSRNYIWHSFRNPTAHKKFSVTKKRKASQPPRSTTNNKINFNRVIRDISVATITKGQAPLLLLLIIVLVVGIRLPIEALGDLAEAALHIFESWHILSFAGNIIMPIIWYITLRKTRSIHHSEMERLTEERNRWQNRALPDSDLPTSDRN